MNDFETSKCINRLLLELLEVEYKPMIYRGDIVFMEKFILKYPN